MCVYCLCIVYSRYCIRLKVIKFLKKKLIMLVYSVKILGEENFI